MVQDVLVRARERHAREVISRSEDVRPGWRRVGVSLGFYKNCSGCGHLRECIAWTDEGRVEAALCVECDEKVAELGWPQAPVKLVES
jgi:hypothetical protein